ncbi:MAG: flagellar biosynthesis repressor FlbT [Verrucomicrobiota bacterium JB022]|nr:flagellar biosynthesis repressor FlbT [Verrucomicrobiota bacterium JB022]
MPLKIKLKPHERIILGGAVITNGRNATEFTIDNKVTLLRAKDIMTEEMANSPSKRIYFVLQMMYIDQRRTKEQYDTYLKLVKDLLKAAPSLTDVVMDVSEALLNDDFYKAMKAAHVLIERETSLINRARGATAPQA